MTESDALHFNPALFLALAGSGRRGLAYRPKETIFRQGAAADTLFYIERGRVQLTVHSEAGKEGVIAMHGAGEFVGEGCLAGQELHLASAIAVGEVVVVGVDKTTVMRALREQPALSEMFVAFMLARNVQLEADLVDHLLNSSERRLARLFLLMADFGKGGKMEKIVPRISQEILAARVGTTRSRINIFMNRFRKRGLIEYVGAAGPRNGGLMIRASLLNVIVPHSFDDARPIPSRGRRRDSSRMKPSAKQLSPVKILKWSPPKADRGAPAGP